MFEWDPQKAIINFQKHGISFEEAATTFADDTGIEWEDLSHSGSEFRMKRVSSSIQDRILMVIYTIRKDENGQETIRIISARQASKKERQAYSGL